jgi:hypothetical protein
MFSGTQRRFSAVQTRRARRLAGLLVLGLFVPAFLQAQGSQAIIGHIEGDDLSVQDSAASASPQNPGSILLTSGSIITVRSGQARIELTAGGQIGVCGAAKFTLLASNAAVTLAVSYGRVRVHLDGSTPLVLYTPTVVATPVAIADGSRDVTLGLEITGSLCVLASHGAVRLQQQFTGETLTVPQPTEMFLAGQQLKALPGGPSHCECDALNARAAPRPSPSIPATAPAVVPAAPAAVAKNAAPETRASVEVSVAAPPPDPHAAQTPKTPPASVPEHEETAWKVVMPTLAFDANAPAAPPEPSPAIILLVREVRIAPDWVFHGTVAAPARRPSASARPAARPAAPPPAAAVVTAPVSARVTPAVPAPAAKVVAPPPAAAAQKPVVASAAAPKKKNDSKPGFFRRLFGARRPPCEGAGC